MSGDEMLLMEFSDMLTPLDSTKYYFNYLRIKSIATCLDLPVSSMVTAALHPVQFVHLNPLNIQMSPNLKLQ